MLNFLKEKRGIWTFLFETLFLWVLNLPLSLLYKSVTTGTNTMGEEYINVFAPTGIIAILLTLVAVVIYSNEFYLVQKKMGIDGEKIKRVVTCILYILFIIIQTAISAILLIYQVEGTAIRAYIFQSEYLNNLMFISTLGIITPLSYLWIIIVRKVLSMIKTDTSKNENV